MCRPLPSYPPKMYSAMPSVARASPLLGEGGEPTASESRLAHARDAVLKLYKSPRGPEEGSRKKQTQHQIAPIQFYHWNKVIGAINNSDQKAYHVRRHHRRGTRRLRPKQTRLWTLFVKLYCISLFGQEKSRECRAQTICKPWLWRCFGPWLS